MTTPIPWARRWLEQIVSASKAALPMLSCVIAIVCAWFAHGLGYWQGSIRSPRARRLATPHKFSGLNIARMLTSRPDSMKAPLPR